MGDVSKHFSRHEFACGCGCGFSAVDAVLLSVLEVIRVHFDAPITITSACRCPAYNAKVGGVKESQHVKGLAADIVVQGVAPGDVYNAVHSMFPDRLGLGVYDDFVHVDVRAVKARWRG